MSFSPPKFFWENVKKGIDTYLLRDTIGSTGTQYIELGQHKRVGGQGEPSAVRVIEKPESSGNVEGIEMKKVTIIEYWTGEILADNMEEGWAKTWCQMNGLVIDRKNGNEWICYFKLGRGWN